MRVLALIAVTTALWIAGSCEESAIVEDVDVAAGVSFEHDVDAFGDPESDVPAEDLLPGEMLGAALQEEGESASPDHPQPDLPRSIDEPKGGYTTAADVGDESLLAETAVEQPTDAAPVSQSNPEALNETAPHNLVVPSHGEETEAAHEVDEGEYVTGEGDFGTTDVDEGLTLGEAVDQSTNAAPASHSTPQAAGGDAPNETVPQDSVVESDRMGTEAEPEVDEGDYVTGEGDFGTTDVDEGLSLDEAAVDPATNAEEDTTTVNTHDDDFKHSDPTSTGHSQVYVTARHVPEEPPLSSNNDSTESAASETHQEPSNRSVAEPEDHTDRKTTAESSAAPSAPISSATTNDHPDEKKKKQLERAAKAEQYRREAAERAALAAQNAAAEQEKKAKEAEEARQAMEDRLQRRKREREQAAEAERRAEEDLLKGNVVATPTQSMRSSRFQKHESPQSEIVVSHRNLFSSDKALEMGINRVASRVDELEVTMRRLLTIAADAGDDSGAVDAMNAERPAAAADRSRLDALEERVNRLELRAKDFTGVCERLHFVLEQQLMLEQEKERNKQFERDREFEQTKRQQDIDNEVRRAELEIERARATKDLFGNNGQIFGLEMWQLAVAAVFAILIFVTCVVFCCCRGSQKLPRTVAAAPARAPQPARQAPTAQAPPPQPTAPKPASPPPPVLSSFEHEIVRPQPVSESGELRNRFLNRWDQSQQ
jgi:hypothetical protein